MAGETMRTGFVVQFTSHYTGYVCFVDWIGVKWPGLRSTTKPIEVAFWPTRAAAERYLAAHGLKEGDFVPVGTPHMTVAIRPMDWDALKEIEPAIRGSVFEVPPRALQDAPRKSAPPAAATPARSGRKRPGVVQSTFSFGD